ncbi:hypothetical protein, partial [Stutzerimonas nitrititolerans]|uniref:hypothetical protein n=1 Tax=Stutzerimonas nitrititolerans TaxID=2482751 RepID=UPI0028A73EB2
DRHGKPSAMNNFPRTLVTLQRGNLAVDALRPATRSVVAGSTIMAAIEACFKKIGSPVDSQTCHSTSS